MSTLRTIWRTCLAVLLPLLLASLAFGQFPWQKPVKRFPEKFDLADEFYWELRGDTAKITPLVTSPAGSAIANIRLPGPPKKEELDGKTWPAMWTTEVGRGGVFVSGVGHNYFTFNDPYFRIILLRAMAWTMNESIDPFKPLVTAHLER